MRHLPSTLFLVSSLGLAVSTAFAQQAQTPGQSQSQQGQVNIQEVLTEFDEDSNMTLSQEEFEKLYDEKLQSAGTAGQSQDAEQLFGEIDADSDNELSQEELNSSTALRTQLQQGQSQASTQGQSSQSSTAANTAPGQSSSSSTSAASQGQTERSTAGAAQSSQSSERSTAGASPGSQSSSSSATGAGVGAAAGAAAGAQIERDTAGASQSDRAGSQSSQIGAAGQTGQSSQTGAAGQSSQSSQTGATSQSSQIGAAGQGSQSSQSSTSELGQSQSSQSATQDRQQTSQAGQSSSSQSRSTAGAATGSQAAGSSQLEQMAMSQPDQLKGKSVKNSAGEDVGEIADLVRSRTDGEVYAVIESGGVLGIGADRAAVKLSELEMEGEDVVTTTSREQLEQMSYQEAQYEPLEEGERQASLDEEADGSDVATVD